MPARSIKIVGARERNLKGVTLELPHACLSVITGPSGSGKSTLLFDVLGREAERRFTPPNFVQSKTQKTAITPPAVEMITGLELTVPLGRPPIFRRLDSIGRYLEASDLLALLFFSAGELFCPECGDRLESAPRAEMASRLEAAVKAAGLDPESTPVTIGARFLPDSAEELTGLVGRLLAAGFTKMMVSGQLLPLEPSLVEFEIGVPFDLVIDRTLAARQTRPRLEEVLSLALDASKDRIFFRFSDVELVLSPRTRCANCGFSTEPLSPDEFRYWRSGRCHGCGGSGERSAGEVDPRSIRMIPCADCTGTRLSPLPRSCTLAGYRYGDLLNGDFQSLYAFLAEPQLATSLAGEGAENQLLERELSHLRSRVELVLKLGLGYLTLNRFPGSVSTGEMQRLRIARQLSQPIDGVTYLLDEPSAGLHPRDVDSLISALGGLVDAGDTVVAVDHDSAMVLAANTVAVLGPGSGVEGGQLIYCGGPQNYPDLKVDADAPETGTGREPGSAGWISIDSASANNLKQISAKIPLGCLTVVAGVSGSGKSSLVRECLAPVSSFAATANARRRGRFSPVVVQPAQFAGTVAGLDSITSVIDLTGLTARELRRRRKPRSSDRAIVATTLGLMNELRRLYALTTEARVQGFGMERFSYLNSKSCCSRCSGLGVEPGSGEYLLDCSACDGKRFRPEIEQVRFKGVSLGEALSLTIREARKVFGQVPRIRRLLDSAMRFGLSYPRLGQTLSSLSSGEMQRLRLAARLYGAAGFGRLILLDEPSFGLDRIEVLRLNGVLRELTSTGDTVVLVEHNVELIKRADWLIELGPGPGLAGGNVIYDGPPEQAVSAKMSLIGPFLY